MPVEFTDAQLLNLNKAGPEKTVQRTTRAWKQTFMKGYKREAQGHRDGSAC